MKRTFIVLVVLLPFFSLARTITVGPFRDYLTLQQAAAVAAPGDTILLHEGNHTTGGYIENLKGNASAWITIRAADGETAIFSGGSQAFHLTDPQYVRIEGLIFEGQTGNGVNIDDGGTPTTPADHVIIENCIWRNMSASGNNDELKLSGLDDFVVRNCHFNNGATNGSLIDMVGCHRGIFTGNRFENGGSNSIQAKGGSSDITIERNRFVNGGQRAVNIGGSTGLAFFRPIDATYEASDIFVYSNVFIGSMAPIAFVGAVKCKVINNTIIDPDRWAVRILQETVDASRFQPCGNNTFQNNIVVFDVTDAPAINVGGNTAPETFTFSNNLWYHRTLPSWTPNTPVAEPGRIVGQNPQLVDTSYVLQANSPAIGKGASVIDPERDYYGRLFPNPRSIGAVEFSELGVQPATATALRIYPNPAKASITIDNVHGTIEIVDIRGVRHWHDNVPGSASVDVSGWSAGTYIIRSESETRLFIKE